MNLELLSRYEYKYVVSLETAERIRRHMAPYCVQDVYNRPENGGYYTIDSLYYDTPCYDFFYDGENRAPRRLKLRVRTYPDAPASPVKIEVKRRVEERVVKSSVLLPRDGWQAYLGDERLAETLSDAARQVLWTFVTLQQTRAAAPRMLVRYERQAWSSVVDDYVRVTFDRRMACQPMTRAELAGWPQRWRYVDDAGSLDSISGYMLEIKFRTRPPAWVVGLVHELELLRQGFSKYNTAVRLERGEASHLWDLEPALAARNGGFIRKWMH